MTRKLTGVALLLFLWPACSSSSGRDSGTGGSVGSGGGGGSTGGSGGGGGSTGGSGGTNPGGDGGSDAGSPAVDAGAGISPDAPVTTSDGPMSTTDGGGAASDAPVSTATCAGKFCDDFEAFAPGEMPGGDWMAHTENGAKFSVDETRAFSGTRSVHFNHNGGMESAMFMELRKPLLPLSTPVVYGRLMYWLNRNPTGEFSHFEIVRGGGPLPGGENAQLNTGAENGKAFINYEPGDCSAPANDVPFPAGEWACYQFAFDGTKNQISEWVNGKAAVGPTTPKGTCWKWPTVVDTLHIGWESYHTPGLIDLWIDDVAVGDQMIPCPAGPAAKP